MEAGYEKSPLREYEAPQGNNNVSKDRTIPELLAFHRIKTVYPVAGSFLSWLWASLGLLLVFPSISLFFRGYV